MSEPEGGAPPGGLGDAATPGRGAPSAAGASPEPEGSAPTAEGAAAERADGVPPEERRGGTRVARERLAALARAARPRRPARERSGTLRRRLAIAAHAALALAIVLTPWYALASYVPSGWDATWWARAALVLALASVLALRAGAARSLPALAATLALALIALRVALPPDFGLDFDGLDVPVERRWGAWLSLGLAAAALLATLRISPPPPSKRPPGW